jgi:hypothetical protein
VPNKSLRMNNGSGTNTKKAQKFVEELTSVWNSIDLTKYPDYTDLPKPVVDDGAIGGFDTTKARPASLSPLASKAECASYNSYGLEEARQTGPSQRKPVKQYPLTPMLSNHNIGGYS